MFQDLHVVDFHAHFPVRGDVSAAGGGVRQYAAGSPAAAQAAYMRAQSERYRAAWRLAWDFPKPEPEREPEPEPVPDGGLSDRQDGGLAAADVLADRWLA